MKKTMFMTLMLISAAVLWGCANKTTEESGDIVVTEMTESVQEQQNVTETVQPTETASDESEELEVEKLDFSELKDLEFCYSSGAGAWRTLLIIQEDGSFSGEFSDSEMGNLGEDYPNGTCYQCSFEGYFTDAVKVNDYTYSMKIKEMGYANDPGTEEIIDEIRCIYTEACGLADAETIYIYLPEAPYTELPEGYKNWVNYLRELPGTDELSFYGLYNEKGEAGFVSYKTTYRMDDLILSTEEWSDTLKEILENEPLSQSDLNLRSKELYDSWDSALNTLWAELKGELSEEKFETLLTEQRQWIKDKEAAVETAAEEVRGGSMESLVKNMTAADWTEKRVYELYELYKNQM